MFCCVGERQFPFRWLYLFPGFFKLTALLTISVDLTPVCKICIEVDLDRKLHRNPCEILDIDVFMHAIPNKPGDPELNGLCRNQTAWPEIRPRIRIDAGRSHDVIAHPRILMHI